jgi:4-amino-4-deoxy-L-arabinose transferase-like glycosyltransferase
LPAALVALVAGLVWRGRAARTDRLRAALLLWGGWLLVTGAVFSLSSGVIHTYYTVALAPAIAALVGMGGAMWWQNRHHLAARAVAVVSVALTAVWALVLLDRTPAYLPWLRILIAAAGTVAVVALLAAPVARRWTRHLTAAAICLGLVAALSGPIAYTATTLSTGHSGSVPSAGPTSTATATAFAPGGGGGGFPSGAIGGAGRRTGEGFPGGTGAPPSGSGSFPAGGEGLGGGGFTRGSFPAGGPGGAGAGGAATTSKALTKALEAGASSYRWVAATFGSQSAAVLELATGDPVMAIGGFSGQGGNLSLSAFEGYVSKGEIHYFIASGAGGGGPGGNGSSDAAITSWVEAHFKAETVGGQTVYDLTSPK